MRNIIIILLLFISTNLFSQVCNINQGGTITNSPTQALKVGTITNYIQIDTAYGTKYFGGTTVWDDQQGQVVSALTGSSQWTQEQFCTTGLIKPFFANNQDDFAQIECQFSHRRQAGSVAEIHIHYIPMAAPSGATDSVVLRYYYTWIPIGTAVPIDSANWTKGNQIITIRTADQYKHMYADINGLLASPPNDGVSSILYMRIIRLSSSAVDNYTTNKTCGGTAAANFCVNWIDAHYVIDTDGSQQELIK